MFNHNSVFSWKAQIGVREFFPNEAQREETQLKGVGRRIKGEIIGAVSWHNLRLITVLRSPPTSDRCLLPFAVVGTKSGAARPSTAAATLPRPRTVRSRRNNLLQPYIMQNEPKPHVATSWSCNYTLSNI